VRSLIADRWQDLGIELGIPIHSLEVIRSDYGNNVTGACTVMFQMWMERDPHASWDMLISAIETVGLRLMAEIIKKMLQPGMYVA